MVAGAVLCGGRSTRMGRDKATTEFRGRPMARWVADALEGGGCDRVFAVGGEPIGLSVLGLGTVPDLEPGEGPLGGVIAALTACGNAEAVVVVGCDTPLLGAQHVAHLIEALESHPDVDVVVGRTDRVQPLFAVWRPRCLVQLGDAFRDGERAVHRVLPAVRHIEVAVPPEAVRNVNTPDDLNG